MNKLDVLETIEGYRQYFMDVTLWKDYVKGVCRHHQLTPFQLTPFQLTHFNEVKAGLAGTYPTFIVNKQWVVKFFGRLFNGQESFEAEKAVNNLLTNHNFELAPTLLAWGNLFEDNTPWHWPYLIFEFIPGVSIGEIQEQVTFSAKYQLAQQLGHLTKQIHRLPLPESKFFPSSWQPYYTLLEQQHAICQNSHAQRQTLPPHLVNQVKSYLLPPPDLIDTSRPPHLIHADLTRDHILGRINNQQWTTLGLIDFGDAMIGQLEYELLALHLDLFNSDKRLLKAYLDTYGINEATQAALPHKMMSLTLLHRFDVLWGPFTTYPHTKQIPTLEELASRLWDVTTPSLADLGSNMGSVLKFSQIT